MKIRTVFQIIFCILAVLAVIAASVLGILYGFLYFLGGAALALVFIALMLWMKNGGRRKEDPQVDFMNSEEENAAIRSSLENAQQQDSCDK